MDTEFFEQLKEKNYNLYFKGVFTGVIAVLVALIYFQVVGVIF